ncbi:MAG TPA: biopolymer transporter ExbD [Thermoanaerobaculia bacterium]|nr:biopolymer transporter ExbD [Thermoanaerobaculia bacterium]
MKFKASQNFAPVIPTASMADIAFLLIIFFMVTITFEVDKTQVLLPRTAIRFEIPKQAAYVSVTESGLIKVSSGEEISTPVPGVEDVLSFATQTVATDPSKPFVLKADRTVPYDIIDKVIDALKQAKVEVIYLLSEQTLQS